MRDITLDQRALGLLKDKARSQSIYQALAEFGDPREWPEYKMAQVLTDELMVVDG